MDRYMDGWMDIVHKTYLYYEPLLADYLGCTYVIVMLAGESIIQALVHAKQ